MEDKISIIYVRILQILSKIIYSIYYRLSEMYENDMKLNIHVMIMTYMKLDQ